MDNDDLLSLMRRAATSQGEDHDGDDIRVKEKGKAEVRTMIKASNSEFLCVF
jgi:hypothetical protein